MSKQILGVGNCGFDHGKLQDFLARHFDGELTPADDADDAKLLLETGSFDLLLVNRKFDRDGGDGMDLIRKIKGDPNLESMPVMLISNYPKYQAQAVAAGAAPGFGKAELNSEKSIDAVNSALA